MADFYTTVVTLEVEITHFSQPDITIDCLKQKINSPAYKVTKVISAKSNYEVHKSPKENLEEIMVEP
jgi:hypothetical protein